MVLKVLIPTWGAVGFYRGMKCYDYNYKKQLNYYENKKNYIVEKPQYFYSNKLFLGLYGLILYVNPFTIILVIPKELYRIEVNIRSLNEEKEKDKYYQLT